MYLTVLGTSAEGADGGEVGRGNRVNGLITFHRPMTLEAAAGKNPVSHGGKIYNLLSRQIAQRIYEQVEGVQEVCVWLCSRIGRPLDDPWSASVELVLTPGVNLPDVAPGVRELVGKELREVDRFIERLCRGEFPIC
jgi:S-adenosylmethionine synthetase